MNATDPTGMEKAKDWRDAERKAARRLKKQGHEIITTQTRGTSVKASRDRVVYGRRYDIVSRKNGVIYVTEVKFRRDAGKKRGLVARVLNRVFRRVSAPAKIYKAGRTSGQLFFDMQDTDVSLSGGQFSRDGKGFSETSGEIQIRWELWSKSKDDTVLNLSTLKTISDPDKRDEKVKEYTDAIMEQISVK